MIWQLKFQQRLLYAQTLGEMLALQLVEAYRDHTMPSLILPVPLHPARLKERGFNQALEIAKPIARMFKLPIEKKCVQRIKATEAQSGLSANKRHANMLNAFSVQKSLNADYVAIVDDVMTTGITVRELSNVLLQSGVKRVDVWCCARR